MTISCRLAIGFVFCLSCSISLLAQARILTEAEFKAAQNNGFKKLESSPHRVNRKAEGNYGVTGAGAKYFVSETSEILPPDRSRSTLIRRVSGGNERTERVTIGERKYLREGGGAWQLEPTDQNRYTIKGDPVRNKESKVFRSLGITNIGKVRVEGFEDLTSRKYESAKGQYTTNYLERFWIDEKGRFLRRESKITEGDNRVLMHSLSEYEYDPSIKIEAPIK